MNGPSQNKELSHIDEDGHACMVKSAGKGIDIGPLRLLEKRGGKDRRINNCRISHLIFTPSSAASHSRNPRRRTATPVVSINRRQLNLTQISAINETFIYPTPLKVASGNDLR